MMDGGPGETLTGLKDMLQGTLAELRPLLQAECEWATRLNTRHKTWGGDAPGLDPLPSQSLLSFRAKLHHLISLCTELLGLISAAAKRPTAFTERCVFAGVTLLRAMVAAGCWPPGVTVDGERWARVQPLALVQVRGVPGDVKDLVDRFSVLKAQDVEESPRARVGDLPTPGDRAQWLVWLAVLPDRDLSVMQEFTARFVADSVRLWNEQEAKRFRKVEEDRAQAQAAVRAKRARGASLTARETSMLAAADRRGARGPAPARGRPVPATGDVFAPCLVDVGDVRAVALMRSAPWPKWFADSRRYDSVYGPHVLRIMRGEV